MRWRGALILLVIGLLLTGVNVWLAWQRSQALQQRAYAELLVPIPARDIEGFRLELADAGAVALERRDNGWWLTEPVADRAELRSVQELLALATFARARAVKAPALPDPAPATLIVRGGEHRVTIRFGPLDEATGRRPVAVGGGDPQWIDAGLTAFLDREPESYRARDLFAGRVSEAQEILIAVPAAASEEGAARNLELARDGAEWRLLAPVRWPAAGGEVDRVLQLCAGLRAKAVVMEQAAELATFGLDQNAIAIQLTTPHLGPQTVRLGPPLEDRPGAPGVALVVGRSPVFAVNDALRRHLSRLTVTACREQRLEPLAGVEAIGEVRIDYGGTLLRLQAGKNRWEGVAPMKFVADTDRIRYLLFQLEQLRAAEFVAEDDGDLAPWGLERPALKLRAYNQEGREVVQLAVGEAADEEGRRYAHLQGRSVVFTLDAAVVQLLSQPWYTFHQRQIAYFELQDARRLAIWQNGAWTRYQRTVGDAWQQTAPQTVPADAMALYRGPLSHQGLGDLQALAYVGTVDDDLSKFGLDPPALRVVVEFALPREAGGQVVSRELHIGTPQVVGERQAYYARLREGELVFLIEGRVVGMLRQDFADPEALEHLGPAGE